MPINNGLRLVSGGSAAGLEFATRFYGHWAAMVHLLVATNRKLRGSASDYMAAPRVLSTAPGGALASSARRRLL